MAVASSAGADAAAGTNVLVTWFRHKLCSRDRVERHHSFLVALLVAASVLFAALKPDGNVWGWGAPVCSGWALALATVTLANVWSEGRNDRSTVFELTRGIQFVLCMLSVLIYYDGSNVINRARFAERGPDMLYDAQLLQMDEALLGWLYPRGQMALYLDTQKDFGVTSTVGRAYAELLQILYISYYFWGNAIGVWLAFKYFYYAVYKNVRGSKKRMQWRRIQMFVAAWVGTFVMNHLVNLCFPAMSPRIHLEASYVNELRGMWLMNGLRNAVKNAAKATYSAFPSGHCGLSMLAVILTFRIGLARTYSYLVLLTTILIVLATQVLRYHYFVDFLFSIPLVCFGAWLGGFHDPELYQKSLVEMGLEDYDEDGRALPTAAGGYSETAPLMALSPGESVSPRSLLATTSPDEDIELGRINPPLISPAVFGISRSISIAKLAEDKKQESRSLPFSTEEDGKEV